MKIGLVVPGFSADGDDWCIPVLVDAVKQLSEYAEVHVFPLRYPGRREQYTVHGATVHPVGGGTARGLSRSLVIGGGLQRIVSEHRKNPFDVLHGVWADEPGFVATLATQLVGVPAVVSVMGGELVGLPKIAYGGLLSRANRLLSTASLKRAARVTAASQEGVRAARRIAGSRHGGRIFRLVWGVDASLFADSDRVEGLSGSPRLLTVGSLVPVKGHRTVLKAVRRLKAEFLGIHLHIVGDGPEKGDLSDYAMTLGIADSVSFHGSIRRENMGEFYRAADLLVVSSWHEMQPAVLLEAALCSLPSVSTIVGMAEDFSALAAEPVTPGDDAQLAGAIAGAAFKLAASGPGNVPDAQHFAGDEQVAKMARSCVGRDAQELIRKEYVSSHTVGSLLGLYGEVVGESRSASGRFVVADAPMATKGEASTLSSAGAGRGSVL